MNYLIFNFYPHLRTFFKKIYLFLERGEGRDKERERNIPVWLPLARPLLGTGPATQCVPWLGIKPVTFWFTGRHSIHWATSVRARGHFFHCFLEIQGEKQWCEREALTVPHIHLDWGSHVPGPGDWSCNLGMCPDREANPQPFGYRITLQPSHSGQGEFFILKILFYPSISLRIKINCHQNLKIQTSLIHNLLIFIL